MVFALVVTEVTDSLHFFSLLGDAFPAGSSPFLSGYPGPSSLTSDPAYRSTNPSSLQMAQLWASHAHDGKSPTCAFVSLFPFALPVHNSKAECRHIFMTFPTVVSCPMPRRPVPLLFLIAYSTGILFHFCRSAGSSAPGSVLNAPLFRCPRPVLCFRLSSVTVICLPLLAFFFEPSVQRALRLCLRLSSSSALLFIHHLPPDRACGHSFRHRGFSPWTSLSLMSLWLFIK